MSKLFGTDGIRGKVDEYPMTVDMISKVGFAVAAIISPNKNNPKIIIGKDTRLSGDKFEKSLISGICSNNAQVVISGIIPTPGTSYLVRSLGFDAGIVISASHNPFNDNGIKVFDHTGFKLSHEKELEIEKIIFKNQFCLEKTPVNSNILPTNDFINNYTGFLKQCITSSNAFRGLKIVMDCAHGAAYQIGPSLFSDLGVDVDPLFTEPNGKNINQDCGSEHPDIMRKKVIEYKADMGIAFDGDADRVILCDETGDIITGDRILAMCAGFLKKQNRLKNNIVVSTVMSNLGLRKALADMGIRHIVTDVGDRHVAESMREKGAVLGGEDSGHIIFMEHQKTGDGLLTALKVLEFMKHEDKPLSELKKVMTRFPQKLLNIPVKSKPNLENFPEIMQSIQSVENSLAGKGRVVVRYSGTEPICRIMVEGLDNQVIAQNCEQIAEVIKKYI